MRSDRGRYRERLGERAASELQGNEQIVALLPFASVPKRPKGPKGKVRTGIHQSWRRYRPLVVTNRRLLVFDSGRTPSPRGLLGSCSLADIGIGPITPGRWDTSQFVLTLPGAGTVPFVTGSREVEDLAALRDRVVSASGAGSGHR